MTPHNHRERVEGCFRCELSDDEIEPCYCGNRRRPNINHRKRIACWTYYGEQRVDICPLCGYGHRFNKCSQAEGQKGGVADG